MGKIKSEKYLEELIDNYQNLIFSICYKLTNDYFIAEDLTQETFLSAFEHAESFQGGNEKAWICRIASNKCIDYQKQASRRNILCEDVALEETRTDTPETSYIEKEACNRFLQECKRLKPPYDEIARMYFYEEKKVQEIANMKEKNVKTIQTQIYRARSMLRKVFREERDNL
ncbi:RNA polymerase sigma factor [[Clostridium] polysaccharolyticum]|uniref:RNA polymerase sigma factor n=1 Tax=[Clostridium] polysaccharolyticum TaxID=29364 RepID=A0A1I0B6F9_9FIRM|nr:RNA polymerase sigma factor [[Clostridium] polysaccharolyticum]SET01619.1 RNA polymerase sigma-70 factor, ECF subfamily [[Clostridium] polysaccharolyticum]